jgi:hypothetical protein
MAAFSIMDLKRLISSGYDLQKLRIQMGNRIAINMLLKMGLINETPKYKVESSEEIETKSKKKDKILKVILTDYKRLTDGLANMAQMKTFEGIGVISSWVEYVLISQYVSILKNEESYFKQLDSIITTFPVWNLFLKDVSGVGPMMTGVLLSTIDIHKAEHVSDIWAFAGLDVTSAGTGRSRKEDSLVEKPYMSKEGKMEMRKSITFNPFLKTKLMGVLAGCFLRSKNERYRQIYDNYKHRLQNNPKWAERSKGHINNASLRYMVKMFLKDLYIAWRTIEGLPVSDPYEVAKLNFQPHHENSHMPLPPKIQDPVPEIILPKKRVRKPKEVSMTL